ncbi:MAG: DUF167 domain-containing protein [Acidimicrobiales bacterium]
MIRFYVHVHPGSRRASVGGSHDGALIVHVRSRAVDLAATKETLLLLAEVFEVRPGAVTCVRGATNRTKAITVEGNDGVMTARLDQLLAN